MKEEQSNEERKEPEIGSTTDDMIIGNNVTLLIPHES